MARHFAIGNSVPRSSKRFRIWRLRRTTIGELLRRRGAGSASSIWEVGNRIPNRNFGRSCGGGRFWWICAVCCNQKHSPPRLRNSVLCSIQVPSRVTIAGIRQQREQFLHNGTAVQSQYPRNVLEDQD